MDNIEQEEINLDESFDENDDLGYVDEEDLGEVDLELTPEEKKVYEKIQLKIKMTDPVLKALAEMKNPPTDEQVQEYKRLTGDEAYFINISDKENFVFRPIKRQEWRALMTTTAKLEPMKRDEAIVLKGILFPKMLPNNLGALNAGTIDTLKEMILRASNFMTPDMAIQCVRKL